MIELSRELVAYAIIGVLVVVAIPTVAIVMRRRKREKLRRRGIKTYGH
jgi:type II secretory pathway pseudopilin PulG